MMQTQTRIRFLEPWNYDRRYEAGEVVVFTPERLHGLLQSRVRHEVIEERAEERVPVKKNFIEKTPAQGAPNVASSTTNISEDL